MTAAAGREERRALWLAAAGFFCLMCGYYTLRPMREALALTVGVEYNFVLFLTTLGTSAMLLPLYWWLVGRTPRGRLPWLVSTPFIVVFLGLAAGLTWYPGNRTVAFVYFVALSSANLYLISLFWSAMSDVWRPDLAKRFFGYVAAGGSAGAILGPFVVTNVVRETGPAPLIVMACAFILASAMLASFARRSLPTAATTSAAAYPRCARRHWMRSVASNACLSSSRTRPRSSATSQRSLWVWSQPMARVSITTATFDSSTATARSSRIDSTRRATANTSARRSSPGHT